MSQKDENKSQIESLTGKIAETVKPIDAKGKIDVESGSIFDSNLPEGLTPKSVSALNNYVANFNAAALHAAKGPAIDALVDNKDLDAVKVVVDLGAYGQSTSKISRQSTNSDPKDRSKEIVTKGSLRSRIEPSGGLFGGRYDEVKKSIKALGEEKL